VEVTPHFPLCSWPHHLYSICSPHGWGNGFDHRIESGILLPSPVDAFSDRLRAHCVFIVDDTNR
jgi:hypothetical protein